MAVFWTFGWPRGLSVSGVTTYTLMLLVTWLTYKVMEPLWSPLRKLPGMPYYPLFGNVKFLMTGEAMESHMKMMKKYGPILRFYFILGRGRLLVADPQMMKHIFVTNGRNYVKPPDRIKILEMLLGKSGLLVSEGDLHAVHKRLMSPAFNSHSIAKMVPAFDVYVRKLLEFWSQSIVNSSGSAVLPIHADLQRATLDIIGMTAFGYDFNCIGNPDHSVTAAFHGILSGFGLSWRTALPFYTFLPIAEMSNIRKKIRLMDQAVFDIISEKRKLIEKGEDLDKVTADVLGKMMMARDEETGQTMTDKELRDQVMTLMLAGHETTAVGMSWCLLMLATHQEIQKKARNEILSVVDPAVGLTYDVVDQLEYCGCVVKETLRLLPPVPMTIRRAERDDILPGGHFVPAGTIINMSLGPMMRRPEIYSDPESFIPERFSEKDTESNVYKFAPFIYGTHQCLGYKFAMIEMKVILAVLLPRLLFELDPNGPVYKRQMAIIMKPDPSLQLRVSFAEN